MPGGSLTATFAIATDPLAPADTIVTLTAWVGNTPRSTTLELNPTPPVGPTFAGLSSSHATLTGGSPATGTARFTGTTDGRVVQLATSDPALVQVPSTVVVPGGSATGAFPITTSQVSVPTTVTITATWFRTVKPVSITLVPGAPAAPDRVAVKTASYSSGTFCLRVEATSSDPAAILTVTSASGIPMFTLQTTGNGTYAFERTWRPKPASIVVRSNLGGSAAATVR